MTHKPFSVVEAGQYHKFHLIMNPATYSVKYFIFNVGLGAARDVHGVNGSSHQGELQRVHQWRYTSVSTVIYFML